MQFLNFEFEKKKGGQVVFKRGIESGIFLNSTWIEHGIFSNVQFFFFIVKLLNKDRITPIPHHNLLNFPKIQHFIFSQNQICQCLNIRIWMEKLYQRLYSRGLFFPKYGRDLKGKRRRSGKCEFKKKAVGQFLNVGQKVGFF